MKVKIGTSKSKKFDNRVQNRINFNDESLPLGVRKVAYVKYAMSKGTDAMEAKRQANEKFGFVKKAGLFVWVEDHGRMGQNSFRESQIYDNYDLRKYEKWQWKERESENEYKRINSELKKMGWDIVHVTLIG